MQFKVTYPRPKHVAVFPALGKYMFPNNMLGQRGGVQIMSSHIHPPQIRAQLRLKVWRAVEDQVCRKKTMEQHACLCDTKKQWS